eukprot:m.110524 g.110524  ORF g.110524 m.110524 type:complete len:247 (-) comp14042_c0_seq3:35-775(-)
MAQVDINPIDPANFKAVTEVAADYAAEFDKLSQRMKKGLEVTKSGLSFVERWLKAEFSYCKACDELFDSRTAKTFMTEPVPELGKAWAVYLEDLKACNERRKEVALAVKETIVGKLSAFADALGPRIDAPVQQGKRVLLELKQSYATLAQKQVQYKKMCDETAEDIELIVPAYEPESKEDVEEVLQLVGKEEAARVGLKPAASKNLASMTPPQKRRLGNSLISLVITIIYPNRNISEQKYLFNSCK